MKQVQKKVKRAKSSLITQIRTEKIGLKSFLYNRRVPGVEKESCECGANKQTARHILHECRLFNRQRRELLVIPRYAVTACETGHYILIRIRSDV